MKTRHSFSHLNKRGEAHMVDVSAKPSTARWAKAQGRLIVNRLTLQKLRTGRVPKGDLWALARGAGILAAKRVAEFVPLAHPLSLSHSTVDFSIKKDSVRVECLVKTTGPTGVELEALMGVWGALITLYDMIKALQKDAVMTDVCLLEKGGGKHHFIRKEKA